jgi:hypothetical protein
MHWQWHFRYTLSKASQTSRLGLAAGASAVYAVRMGIWYLLSVTLRNQVVSRFGLLIFLDTICLHCLLRIHNVGGLLRTIFRGLPYFLSELFLGILRTYKVLFCLVISTRGCRLRGC